MITLPNQNDAPDLLPIDGRLTISSKNESWDGVAFVSGIQGVICTTFMVEELLLRTGESRQKRVCGSAVLAIPMDLFTLGEITPNWKIH